MNLELKSSINAQRIHADRQHFASRKGIRAKIKESHVVQIVCASIIVPLACVYVVLHGRYSFPTSSRNSFLPVPHLSEPHLSDVDVVVFYHIFIPLDRGQAGIDTGLSIVNEQISQVGESYAAKLQQARRKGHGTKQSLSVNYVTVGAPDAVTAEFMKERCDKYNLTCTQVASHRQGYEEWTLQRMHNHCREHPQDRAIYIHTKGSYHTYAANHHWRRYMTSAVTSKHCLDHPSSEIPGQSCNVCGLTFQPLWTLFFVGNFFVADCEYVAQLLPPSRFEKSMRKIARDAILKHDMRSQVYAEERMVNSDFWGVDRYANEHWVGSHPQFVPCDISKHQSHYHWITGNRREREFQWSLAPRHRLQGHKWPGMSSARTLNEVLVNRALRLREYVFLAGLIYRWYALYNTTPPDVSWVWSYFPDGDFWLSQTQKYGSRVVDVVLNESKIFQLT